MMNRRELILGAAAMAAAPALLPGEIAVPSTLLAVIVGGKIIRYLSGPEFSLPEPEVGLDVVVVNLGTVPAVVINQHSSRTLEPQTAETYVAVSASRWVRIGVEAIG